MSADVIITIRIESNHGFLTKVVSNLVISRTRLKTDVCIDYVGGATQRQRREIMISVSVGHIEMAPIKSVGSGHLGREPNP